MKYGITKPGSRKVNGSAKARLYFVAFCVSLNLSTFHLFISGQTIPDQPATTLYRRPKIGLVLSGGGARGFAHIGVIKALEENHIPVDYIAGASMGALVGALYSTGRSPDEIEQLVEALDWNKLLRGKPALSDLTYRRKEDRRNLPGAITLGGKDPRSLRLPSSLNPGHEIGLVIDHLLLPYGDKTNFDSLPIPFRCVATDLVGAETVVLKDGSLAQALRATMAIPAVFAPVEIDGKVLADGGILNNIPTDVAKAMGADIIIVVNIETEIGDRSSLQDLIGVLGQTFLVATVENSRRSLRQADIIIAPDLKNYSTFDFGSGKEIVKLGYDGAEAKIALLKSLRLNDADWQRYVDARRTKVLPRTEPRPDFLAIEGTQSRSAERRIEQRLDHKYENKPLDEKALADDLTKLTGTDRFDNLGYGISQRGNKTGLVVHVYDPPERTDRAAVFQVGVDVNNADHDDVNFVARGRLTIFDVGAEGNEWRNDISLGSTSLLATEFYHPFGNSSFFAAPNAMYGTRRINFYQDGNRLAEYDLRTLKVGGDFGYSLGRNSEVRFGLSIAHLKGTRRIGDPLLPDLSGEETKASLRWNVDTRDSALIPTHGFEVRSSVNYYFEAPGSASGFTQAESRFSGFRSAGDRYVLFAIGGAGTTFSKTAPLFEQFALGGLFDVGGYGSGEFRNSNYVKGGFGVLRKTYSLPPYVGGKLYLGGFYEGGSSFETWETANYRQSVTAGAVLETRLGPIFLGGSLAEGGKKKLYFSLGRFF